MTDVKRRARKIWLCPTKVIECFAPDFSRQGSGSQEGRSCTWELCDLCIVDLNRSMLLWRIVSYFLCQLIGSRLRTQVTKTPDNVYILCNSPQPLMIKHGIGVVSCTRWIFYPFSPYLPFHWTPLRQTLVSNFLSPSFSLSSSSLTLLWLGPPSTASRGV